jgi:hypothetical protein
MNAMQCTLITRICIIIIIIIVVVAAVVVDGSITSFNEFGEGTQIEPATRQYSPPPSSSSSNTIIKTLDKTLEMNMNLLEYLDYAPHDEIYNVSVHDSLYLTICAEYASQFCEDEEKKTTTTRRRRGGRKRSGGGEF